MEGLKGYCWRRKRGYERLNGARRRRKNRVEYLSTAKKRRFWKKINLKPRLKLKLSVFRRLLSSPKNLLLNMRDAYVNLMLKIANSKVMSSGLGGGFGGADCGFGMRQFKEYDDKMLVEIYKSMVIAQAQAKATGSLQLVSQAQSQAKGQLAVGCDAAAVC